MGRRVTGFYREKGRERRTEEKGMVCYVDASSD